MTYGAPRTATTLCHFNVLAFACATRGAAAAAAVVKTHKEDVAAAAARAGAAVFATRQTTGAGRRDDPFAPAARVDPRESVRFARALEQRWGAPAGAVAYVQETADVAQREWRVVDDYARAFGVAVDSPEGMLVVEYMRLWDVLRRCCGPQMSEDYRSRLLNKTKPARWGPPRPPGALNYDACEIYDVAEVERRLAQSQLFRRCPKLRDLEYYDKDTKEDMSWAVVKVGFCAAYEAAAIETQAPFNANPFELEAKKDGA